MYFLCTHLHSAWSPMLFKWLMSAWLLCEPLIRCLLCIFAAQQHHTCCQWAPLSGIFWPSLLIVHLCYVTVWRYIAHWRLLCALDLHMCLGHVVNEYLVGVFLYTSSLSVKSRAIESGWLVLGYDVCHSFDASHVFSLLSSIVCVVNERRRVGHFDLLCSLGIYMLYTCIA